MSDENTKDLTGDSFSDREILLALRQGLLDLTADVRAVKGQVSELSGQVSELNERVTRLENRTNPLPPNYEERFAVLEENSARIPALEKQLNRALRAWQETWTNERDQRFDLEDRVKALETKAA